VELRSWGIAVRVDHYYAQPMMTWQEALEIVVSRTGHNAFQKKCDEGHPHHISWRAEMIRMASGEPRPRAPGPSLMTQLGTAARAGMGVASAVAHRQPVLVSDAEYERRLTICRACPEYMPDAIKCRKCGCFLQLKARLATEDGQCPEDKW
jgi:hypothetical protein